MADKAKRIAGYDLARGLAVLGMFIMNFKIVMQGGEQTAEGFWPVLLVAGEGRFAVLFIVLAGIGVSLMTRRPRMTGDRIMLWQKKTLLIRRAVFLFFAGLLFFPVWEADILHYYGIYIGLAVFILTWSDRQLWAAASVVTLIFVVLFIFFDWEQGWDWHSLSYTGFWTPAGNLSHTLFNGFHPLFPWFAFFIFGMILGRYDWTDRGLRRLGFRAALAVTLVCETVSYLWAPAMVPSGNAFWLSTLSFPPFPLFVLSGGASSLAVILVCILITEKIPLRWLNPLIYTGQMVLTHYIFHVIIAMAVLEGMGRLYNQPLGFAVTVAAGYFFLSILFSLLWRAKFTKGPMETVMRKICG